MIILYQTLLLKLKLYLRDDLKYQFKDKLKINYLLLFIPFYIFLIHNISIFNNFFFATDCFFLVIMGLDFHSTFNKTNLNTIMLFNNLLNWKNSLKLSFISDLLIKIALLIPILFFIKEKLLLFFLALSFVVFSFFLKELVSNGIFNKKIYLIFCFFYTFIFTFFGGLFLEFTTKQIKKIEYINSNFYKIYLLTLGVNILLSVIFITVYLKRYHKTIE